MPIPEVSSSFTAYFSDEAIEKLTGKLEDLEHRLDSIASTGSIDTAAFDQVPVEPVATDPIAAQGSCPNVSPIHMHFQGEGKEHDHGDHKEAHVHIDLGLDFHDFHDFNEFHGRPGKKSKCRSCQEKHLDSEGMCIL